MTTDGLRSSAGLYLHNGSVVVDYPERGLIVYDRPRKGIYVKPGTVLFKGRPWGMANIGDTVLRGQAFVFRKGCKPAGDGVSGNTAKHTQSSNSPSRAWTHSPERFV